MDAQSQRKNEGARVMTNTPKIYFDEQRQKWMIDDYGRPREATPEEIEAYANSMPGQSDD